MSEELENRFLKFAVDVRDFCRRLKKDVINVEYIRQLIRASGSVGSNYIESSDDLGIRDEQMKIKIARREVKESTHWLQLVLTGNDPELENTRKRLIDESLQIRKILSTILLRLR